MVKVNIVSDKDGWVLQRISEELHKRLPDSEIYPFGAQYREADWTWYCHFSLCLRENVSGNTAGLFTHFVPGQEQAWKLASRKLDHCFSMSQPWLAHLPKEKSSVTKCGLFDHFIHPLRILFINKENNGNAWRKGVTLQRELKAEFPGVEWMHINGGLSNMEMVEKIRSADYICSTSRVEGGAMPYIEAIALGKNLILRNSKEIGYLEECKYHGDTLTYSSDKELFNIIQMLINTREALHEEFSWDRFAEQHLKIFSGKN